MYRPVACLMQQRGGFDVYIKKNCLMGFSEMLLVLLQFKYGRRFKHPIDIADQVEKCYKSQEETKVKTVTTVL